MRSSRSTGPTRCAVRAEIRGLALGAATLLAGGCSWFTDFKDQPRIEPWEAEYAGDSTTPFRGNPQYSVPLTGNPVPAYVVSYGGSATAYPGAAPNPLVVDSLAGIPNPVPPNAASLDNGRKYYQINCAVCHGAAGRGNGAAVRYGVPAPTLLTDVTKNRTDGYLWGMMRNGRGLMPTYDRIEDNDRWDVVNYVRSLQGMIPGVVADTSPAGYPGENGAFVPGATRTAPTRPAPYRPSDVEERMGATVTRAAPADSSGARRAPRP